MNQPEQKADVGPFWVAYKERGDLQAREQLIVNYIHLIKYVVGRLAKSLPPHVDADDLYSYGAFGLINAVERFDPARGVKFETYAITRIRGSILDGLRSMDWVPSSVRKRAKDLDDARARLGNRLGRSATDEEVSQELGVDLDNIGNLVSDLSRAHMMSFDALWPAGDADGDESEVSLKDLVGDEKAEDPFESAAASEAEDVLGQAIQTLPEKEKRVITLYYHRGLTGKELGAVMGLSVSRVSQIHSQALLRLRGKLDRFERAIS